MMAMKCWLLLTLLVVGATSASAATSVSLVATPYQHPGAGKDVVVAVSLNQASGVTSMDLAYAYNASVLTPTGVFLTGFSAGSSLVSNLHTPGTVEIHLSRPAGFSGTGDAAWVTFRVANGVSAGTITPLSWTSVVLNAGSIPCGEQGMGLAIAVAPAAMGAPHNAYGTSGSLVSVPITASSLPGGSAFDTVVTFDPNVLSASSVQETAFAGCLIMVSNVSVPGTVRVSQYGLCNVTGTGALLNIVFNVVGPNGSRTPLNVTRGEIEEEHIPSVLDDGLFNVCNVPDGDGDGFSVCAGDCNDANAAVHPGAVETCNGVDDDCSGTADDVAAPTGSPVIGLAEDNGDAILAWSPVPGSTGYDVVRGNLSTLASTAGDFAQSTNLCLADDSAASTAHDFAIPAAGQPVWYLVRPSNCGVAGTYDGGGSQQAAPRDPGIAASAFHCP